jgi:hypothetical protein
MSRISRYQDSIHKFMKNRSSINDLSDSCKPKIFEIIKDLDHIPAILLLNVLSTQSKKNNMALHGYYMASGIEMLNIILQMDDRKDFYKKKYAEDYEEIIKQLLALLNLTLAHNMEAIYPYINKDKDKDRTFKIMFKSSEILNKKMSELICEYKFNPTENIKKTDLVKYHFEEKSKEYIKEKMSKFKKISKDELITYIHKKYGTLGQLSLMLGWLLGTGDEKIVNNLEKMGLHFGMILKISNDFNQLENDIEHAVNYTTNIVINLGIQESFELFMENKVKFIQGCTTDPIGLYSNTVKEIIDLLESKIDIVIDKTSPDMKSQYTLKTCTESK